MDFASELNRITIRVDSRRLELEGGYYRGYFEVTLTYSDPNVRGLPRSERFNYMCGEAHFVRKGSPYLGRHTLYDVEQPKADFRTFTPEVADILACVAMDATAADYACFEEWADCTGYDPDSRAAERIYHACRENHTKLFRLLGSGEFIQWLQAQEW